MGLSVPGTTWMVLAAKFFPETNIFSGKPGIRAPSPIVKFHIPLCCATTFPVVSSTIGPGLEDR